MNKFIKEFLMVLSTLVYMTIVAICISVIRVVFGDTLTALSLSVIVLSLLVALFMRFIDKVEF